MAATTTKKAPAKRVAKRTEEVAPVTEVIEGTVVEEGDVHPDFEAMEAIKSPETAADYARKYIAEFHADLTTGERASVKAAKAAAAAVLGKWAVDDKAEKGDNQITLSDLGALLAEGVTKRLQKDGTYKAYSKAMVTGWIVAGTAYARGIDPESNLGKAILARYGQFGPIREAIQADNFSPERIEKAIEAKKKEESTPKTSTEVTVTPAEPKTPLEKVQAALAGLSKDEAHAVLTEAMAWVDSDAEAEKIPA